MVSPESVPDRIRKMAAAWQPEVLAEANGQVVRLARLEGAFGWHTHEQDELFLCWSGRFRIELRGVPAVELAPGDLFVVARGTEHRPVADEPAYALIFEPQDTRQHGD